MFEELQRSQNKPRLAADSARTYLCDLRFPAARSIAARTDRLGNLIMAGHQFVVDRECVASSFREWQEEQQELDAQLAESVAALDAYQSHLDNWQQELVCEREELRQLREELQTEGAASTAGSEQLAELTAGLENSRAEVERLQAELATVRVHEQELSETLAAQQRAAADGDTRQCDALDAAIEDAASSRPDDTTKNGQSRAEPRRGANPVLSSVMEQFGKLRQQRSLNRSTNKTR